MAVADYHCLMASQSWLSFLPLQPHEAGSEEQLSVEEQARQVLEMLSERIPPSFDLDDIRSRVDEPHPFTM